MGQEVDHGLAQEVASMRIDLWLVATAAVPGYMTFTEKFRLQSAANRSDPDNVLSGLADKDVARPLHSR